MSFNTLSRLPSCRSPQAGRTLIELLVAIALGLLILLGVGSLYMGASQTTRATSSVASAEETGQIALAILGNAIRRAGYAEIIGTGVTATSRDNLLYNGPLVRGCRSANFNNIAANDFNCSGASTTDMLAIWFQADSALSSPQAPSEDCLGNPVVAAPVANPEYAARVANIAVVRNVYFVAGNALRCTGAPDPNNGNAAQTQTLVSGVEDFKVYFGFDDDAYANAANWTERPTARSIRDAANLIALFPDPSPTVSRWDFVVSVHVCVLVRTEEVGVTADNAIAYTQCPQTAAQAADPTTIPMQTNPDGRVRRAFSQVFTMRARATPTPAV